MSQKLPEAHGNHRNRSASIFWSSVRIFQSLEQFIVISAGKDVW
jgi:hypothetical protein